MSKRNKQYKIVYRVQLRKDNTVGPYRRWVDEHCDASQRRRLMGRPYIRTEGFVSSNMYFGFPHKKALYKWFTKRDLVQLRLAGYVIAKYKVHHDYLIIDQRPVSTQCAFELNRAELLEAA